MTEHDHVVLTAYVRQIGDLFGLRDWDLVVLEEPANDDRFGDCVTATGRKRAEIRFSYNVRQWPADHLRWVTIHELMHCHLAALQDFVIDQLARRGSIALGAYQMLEEYAVDAVASAVAGRFPTIEW